MATNPALWTSTAQTEMYRFFAVAFNAAPGTTYMDQLYDAVTSGMSTEQIVEVFTSKSQFTNVYPRFMSNKDFATKLVNNVVGSSATDAAKATAVADIEAALASGYSRGKVVYQIFTNLANKTADDATWAGTAKQMANQVAVSKYYTETLLQGGENLATLQKVIAGVTKDTAVGTTAALQSIIDTAVPTPGQTFTLTTGVDNVTGTSGPDLVTGTVNLVTAAENTYSSSDAVNGGAGTDALQITIGATGTTAGVTQTLLPTQQTVETVRIINVDSAATNTTHTFNANSSASLATAEVSSSSKAVNFTNLSSPANVKLSAVANTAAVDFAFKSTSYTGTADKVSLTLNSNSGDVTVNSTGAGIEAADITVLGTNTTTSTTGLIGAGADIKSVTVSGSGSLVIQSGSLTAVTSLDASANTGGVSYGATAVNATIMGGAGADTLTGSTGNDTITGGAGADTITAGAGNDNVDAGAGNDTVTLQSGVNKSDTIVGGDGTDVLIVSSALGYSTTSGTNDASGISGFETIRAAATVTQNMKALATNNTIATAVLGGGSLTLQESPTIATLTGSSAGTFTIGLATNGTADTLQVNVGSASGTRAVTVNANEYETINVASTGTAGNTVTIGATQAGTETVAAKDLAATDSIALTGITVTGTKSVTVNATSNALSLASVDASGFTGDTFSFTASSASTKAISVKAGGAYGATITTAKGADTITLGDPGTSTGHSVTAGDGADTVTSGSGNDTIVGGDGNNVVLGGAGNDSITGSTGTAATGDDWFKGEAGDDTLVGNAGADTLEGGDGNDSLNGGAGADSIIGGDGNDNIDSGSGSDFVSGGAGADTINAGAGDDTVDGGAGNDVITIASLTGGDSIDGGTGTDRLTITAVAADATPSGITGIEDFRVDALGGGSTSITVDFTKVSGITSMVATSNQSGGTLTVKNLPTTLTTLSLADGNTAGDTLALSYSSGPTSLTLNSFGNTNSATNITSLNAPLTINGKLTTNQAGDAQVFSTQITSLGTVTTDATTITVTSDSLTAAASGTEVTVGTITDNVLLGLTVTSGDYSDVTVSSADVTTTSAEFASATLTAGVGSTVTVGEIVANSASAVSLKLTTGAQGTIVLGNGAVNSFTSAAVGLDVNLGNQSTLTSTNIIADSYSSVKIVAAAGVTATAPGLTVDSVSGTISAMTLTSGVGSALTVSVGDDAVSTFKPKSVGAVTVSGDGRVNLSLYDIATADTATASSYGAISAASMTSSLSQFSFTGSDVTAKRLTITGGAGNDTITGGTGNDTITGGAGRDSLVGGNGKDVYVYSVGDSNPVASGGAGTSVGQDTVTVIEADDVIRLNITSADNSFVLSTHVKLGTAGATTDELDNLASFSAATLLVQTGAVATGDNFDIAITKASGWTDEGTAQGIVAVNLTGTAVADTLTTGSQADTINGGAGNDTISGGGGNDSISGSTGDDSITGGTGADTLTGGSGNDQFIHGINSNTPASDSSTTDADVITDFVYASDTIKFVDAHGTPITFARGADDASGDVTSGNVDVLSLNGVVTSITKGNGTSAVALTIGTSTEVDTLAEVVALIDTDYSTAGNVVTFAFGADSYVFIQNGTTDGLIKLAGVTGLTSETISSGVLTLGGG